MIKEKNICNQIHLAREKILSQELQRWRRTIPYVIFLSTAAIHLLMRLSFILLLIDGDKWNNKCSASVVGSFPPPFLLLLLEQNIALYYAITEIQLKSNL